LEIKFNGSLGTRGNAAVPARTVLNLLHLLLFRNQFSRCTLNAGETPAFPRTVEYSNSRFETEPVLLFFIAALISLCHGMLFNLLTAYSGDCEP